MCMKTIDNELAVNEPSHKAFIRTFLSKSTIEYNQGDYLSCPIGVLFLLSTLLGSGAVRKTTGDQIARSLKLKSDFGPTQLNEVREESKALFKELHQSLLSEQTTFDKRQVQVIHITTGLFIQNEYSIQPKFRWSIQEEFKGTIEELDFKNQSLSTNLIDGWVNSETRGLIPRFFRNPQDLPTDTRMALINILYFKDQWENPFEPHTTTLKEFHMSNERSMKVPMMISDEVLNYAKFSDDGFQMISKPLKNERFSFVVLLPIEKFDLKSIETMLNGQKQLSHFMNLLQETTVSLNLPKFKLEKSIDLIRTAESMNIVDLFRPEQADLSGITTEENLYIKIFKQSTVLKVDESGIEAAAVTAAIAVPLSLIHSDVEFHVTHPFICFVYDKYLKIPLIAARVIEPKL